MKNFNAISEARPTAPPRAWRRGGRAVSKAALFVAVAGLAACDGDNLFNGGADDYMPVATVNAPDQIVAGQVVPVRVDAYAARGVAQVAVSFDGVIAFDTVIDVKPAKPSVSSVVPVQIPQALAGTSLRVRAQAIDQLGAFSATAEKMIDAYGPPYVQIVGAPVSVQPGQEIGIDVSAAATERVDQIALKLSGAVDKDTTITVSPPSQNVRQLVKMTIPASVNDTLLTITATARDQIGNRGSQSTVVPFAVQAPTVDLIAPASVLAGRVLNLQVAAHGLRKISRVGVDVWGGGVAFSAVPPVAIAPEQVNVTRIVSVQVPGNILESDLYVRAWAEDRSGVRSYSAENTVMVPLDGPVIESIDAPGSVTAGHYFDVPVTASGARPIKELVARWRGFQASLLDTLAFAGADTTITIAPPRSPVTSIVTVEAPCVTADGAFILNVTARDEADELSAIATEVVLVLADAGCAPPDTAGDTTSTAGIAISAAPGLKDAAPRVDLSGARAAALPGRSYRLRSPGRVRRSRTAR